MAFYAFLQSNQMILALLSGLTLPLFGTLKQDDHEKAPAWKKALIALSMLCFLFGTLAPVAMWFLQFAYQGKVPDVPVLKWSFLLLLTAAGFIIHLTLRRTLTPELDKVKKKLVKKTQLEREVRTDVRHVRDLLPVSEVWGIGRRLTTRLNSLGIKTALDLADTHLPFIRKTFGVTVERTVRELNGISCISVDELPAKEQIICSRSFGERITTLEAMHEAVCQYAERAAEKLRGEKRFCRHITVFVRTSPFSNEPYYSNSASQKLMLATKDTRDIVAAAVRALDQIWRDGFRYQKAGIILNDLTERAGQIDLFDDMPTRENSGALMEVLDNLNRSGNRVWFAGQGVSKGWKMKRDMLSPAYTTSWRDIPSVFLK